MTTESSHATNDQTRETDGHGPIAAIDIGSNSFHLITARINNGALQPLVADKKLVRLAEGLGDDGMLSEKAMQRGLDVLKSFALTIADIPAASCRVVATFTLRRAKNADEFLVRAREFMPIPIEIISGDEEARLIYQGISHTYYNEGQCLAVDIGGGSTEFAIGKKFSILQLSSQPLGCVVYTRRFFADGIITATKFRAAEIATKQRLEIIYQRFLNTGWDVAYGSSGTAKAIGQYLHDSDIPFENRIHLTHLHQMREQFIERGHSEKLNHVDESRRPVIAAGLAILIGVFEQLSINEMQISEAALREGVLYELPDRMRHHDIRERTVDSLLTRYDVDTDQVKRISNTANSLFSNLLNLLDTEEAETAQDFLRWTISLHELGLQINRHAIQRHSAYIVKNAELPGFSNNEQELLACLLGSYRKRFNKKHLLQSNLLKPSLLLQIAVTVRVSILLNIRRLDDFLPEITSDFSKNKLKLEFPEGWLAQNSLIEEDLRIEADRLADNDFSLQWS